MPALVSSPATQQNDLPAQRGQTIPVIQVKMQALYPFPVLPVPLSLQAPPAAGSPDAVRQQKAHPLTGPDLPDLLDSPAPSHSPEQQNPPEARLFSAFR